MSELNTKVEQDDSQIKIIEPEAGFKAGKKNRGVNTVITLDDSSIKAFFLIKSLKNAPLYPYIGDFHTKQLNIGIQVLMVIKVYPYRHKAALMRFSGFEDSSLKKVLGYLLRSEYVSTSSHARLILPMDRWTFDTTYVITRKGKKLLRAIFESVGIGVSGKQDTEEPEQI